MTRFPSERLWAALLGLSVLAGCETSSGVRTRAIVPAEVAAAYIPLHKPTHLGIDSDNGAAVVIAPGLAVTNGHNRNLLDPKIVVGEARDYDLLFFRTPRVTAVPTGLLQTGPPQIGAPVIAYGQGADGELRLAHGVVRSLKTCSGCDAPAYFIFAGNAGPGFSGGPVLDEEGRLIGITFGYKDQGGERLIYAYDMVRVREELRNIRGSGALP